MHASDTPAIASAQALRHMLIRDEAAIIVSVDDDDYVCIEQYDAPGNEPTAVIKVAIEHVDELIDGLRGYMHDYWEARVAERSPVSTVINAIPEPPAPPAPPTNAKKRARVRAALDDDPTASDRAIAKVLGVSHTFVRLIRNESANVSSDAGGNVSTLSNMKATPSPVG